MASKLSAKVTRWLLVPFTELSLSAVSLEHERDVLQSSGCTDLSHVLHLHVSFLTATPCVSRIIIRKGPCANNAEES
jgi:hypothetical protein